jgi:aryl carrier-like protein
VFLAGDEPTAKRLCAAVKTEPGTDPLPAARPAVEARLAPYARPQAWFTVAEFPLDRNGKVDLRALAATPSAPDSAPPPPRETSLLDLLDMERLVADAWTEALGTDDFDLDEGLFDVGGDSLAVARKLIQRRLGSRQLPLTDLYRFPTVQSLAQHLHAQTTGTAA